MKSLEYYLNLNWTYRFIWSNEDDCYVASVAELKGCVADGVTLEEAAKNIKDALNCHLSAMLEAGFEIPEPLKMTEYRGNIAYRTTSEKHYGLAQLSKLTGKSINTIIDEAVEEKLRKSA